MPTGVIGIIRICFRNSKQNKEFFGKKGGSSRLMVN